MNTRRSRHKRVLYGPAHSRTAAGARAARGRRSKVAIAAGVVLAVVLLLVVVAALIGRQVVMAGSSDLAQLSDQQPVSEAETTQIYTSDGSLLAYLYGEQNRTVISSDSISDDLKHAIVAIEDQRFYQHNGIDYQGLARALVADLKAGKAAQGASTITEPARRQPVSQPTGSTRRTRSSPST